MTLYDEGYTKYNCNWIRDIPLPSGCLVQLNQWREKLFNLGFIGEYDNGIGFGNISVRTESSHNFIISGTQTGGLPQLTPDHYTTVIAYDWDKNTLTCQGPVQASSESLTHAAIYAANPTIQAVIHIHNRQLWESLMGKVPTTAPAIEYGTPEMAREIIRLCREQSLLKAQILVMSGHYEGVMAFGESLEAAGNLLLGFAEAQVLRPQSVL
jgi:ribulose-5-phosphate 4-epimerase/fuculose-1-phosphate aldolase